MGIGHKPITRPPMGQSHALAPPPRRGGDVRLDHARARNYTLYKAKQYPLSEMCRVSLRVAVGEGDGLAGPLLQHRVALAGEVVAPRPVHLGGPTATTTKPEEVSCVLKKATTEVQRRQSNLSSFHGNSTLCQARQSLHSLKRTAALQFAEVLVAEGVHLLISRAGLDKDLQQNKSHNSHLTHLFPPPPPPSPTSSQPHPSSPTCSLPEYTGRQTAGAPT